MSNSERMHTMHTAIATAQAASLALRNAAAAGVDEHERVKDAKRASEAAIRRANGYANPTGAGHIPESVESA